MLIFSLALIAGLIAGSLQDERGQVSVTAKISDETRLEAREILQGHVEKMYGQSEGILIAETGWRLDDTGSYQLCKAEPMAVGMSASVTEEEAGRTLVSRAMPSDVDGSFKSFMAYEMITAKNSAQYQLQQQAYTDGKGLRKINDDFCVAVGSGFDCGIGQRIVVTLDTGQQFTAIVSDQKSDRHTDASKRYCAANNSILEFIVDGAVFRRESPELVKAGNVGCLPYFEGGITKIEVIEE